MKVRAKLSRYRAIAIDCYGTLVSNEPSLPTFLAERLSARVGLPPEDILLQFPWETAMGSFVGKAYLTEWEQCLKRLETLADRLGIMIDAPAWAAEAFALQRIAPAFPDAERFLQRHPPEALTVISNADNANLLATLSHHGWSFRLVVSSEDAREYKPSPGIFALTARRLGIEPEEMIYIGDSWDNDVCGATAAGHLAIWLNRKLRPLPGPAPRGLVAVVDSLDALE